MLISKRLRPSSLENLSCLKNSNYSDNLKVFPYKSQSRVPTYKIFFIFLFAHFAFHLGAKNKNVRPLGTDYFRSF